MENLAGDLLLGLKFVKLPILPKLFIHFVQSRMGELRSQYWGLKCLVVPNLISSVGPPCVLENGLKCGPALVQPEGNNIRILGAQKNNAESFHHYRPIRNMVAAN